MHHADRESQYVNIRYNEGPVEAGIEPSVCSVGDSYDFAFAETVINLSEIEVIYRRGFWRSFEAVEFAILGSIEWSNNRCLLELIDNISPAEVRGNLLSPA